MRSANSPLTALAKLALVLGPIFAVPESTRAQEVNTYIGSFGVWDDPENWSSGNYPDNGQPTPGTTYDAIVNSSTVRLNGNFTVNALTLTGGTIASPIISGPQSLAVNDLFLWQGGAVSGNVTFNLADGIEISGATGKTMNVTNVSDPANAYIPVINHSGTGNWSGGNLSGTGITTGGNDSEYTVKFATFNNLSGSVFNATAAGYNFGLKFINTGTVNVDAGAGGTVRFSQFRNDGAVHVRSGTLALTSTYRYTASGDFVLDAGTSMLLSSYTLEASSSVTGDGNVTLTAANTINGLFEIGGTVTLDGGVQTWNSEVKAGGLIVDNDGVDVFGPGEFIGTGRSTWVQGLVGGDAVLNFDGGLDLTTASDATFTGIADTVVVNIGGDSTWSGTGSGFRVLDDAAFNVTNGGTLTVQGSRAISALYEGQGGTYSVQGTLIVDTGAAFGIGNFVTGSSTGTVVVRGTLSGLNIEGGELRMEGGESISGSMTGGSVTGEGRIRTSVSGTTLIVSPGTESDPIGQLFMHDLTLGENSLLNIDIAGRLENEFDRIINDDTGILANDGELTIGGHLNIYLINGSETQITLEDTFTIMQAALLIDGAFVNVAAGDRLVTADGLGSFLVHYGSESIYGDNMVVLSDFVAVPEPGYAIVIAALLAGWVGYRRIQRRA